VLVGPDRSSAVGALLELRRSWWFCTIDALRPVDGTYGEFDLDAQPPVDGSDDSLWWLESEPEHTAWTIDDSDAVPQRRLTTSELSALVPADLVVPAALLTLAARPELQRRIRSATACYLDLGDVLVPTAAESGYLLHLLSDQQWVRHWLIYLDRDGNESVVTTSEPVGFLLPDDDEDDYWEPRPPAVIPLDGTFDLQVCADSVAEFLFRFWVENELSFADRRRDSSALASYRAALAAHGSA
jgi:hypothetical protein